MVKSAAIGFLKKLLILGSVLDFLSDLFTDSVKYVMDKSTIKEVVGHDCSNCPGATVARPAADLINGRILSVPQSSVDPNYVDVLCL